jgi:hypothetical protein
MENENLNWIKASASNSQGNCVQLATGPDGGVLMRDSKNPQGPRLEFTRGEIAAFLDGAKRGEFDLI